MSENFESMVVVKPVDEEIHILLVDDEEIMRELLREVIDDSLGYNVELASSAEEGLEKYREGYHQIIVLDIRLSGKITGMDLLKKIKQTDPWVNILMITGYATIDLAVECMKAGAWDFITKPFSNDHFVLIVKRAVENILLKRIASQSDYYKQLSRLDGLTELYNRRLFDTLLKKEVLRCKRYSNSFSLLLMDIDNFKTINDRFGHPKGDEILKTVALTLKTASRASDMLFRYGGDEFAFILPETAREGALIFSQRLMELVRKIILEGHTPEGAAVTELITICIGGVSYPEGGADEATLIQKADQALLSVKKNKNTCLIVT